MYFHTELQLYRVAEPSTHRRITLSYTQPSSSPNRRHFFRPLRLPQGSIGLHSPLVHEQARFRENFPNKDTPTSGQRILRHAFFVCFDPHTDFGPFSEEVVAVGECVDADGSLVDELTLFSFVGELQRPQASLQCVCKVVG